MDTVRWQQWHSRFAGALRGRRRPCKSGVPLLPSHSVHPSGMFAQSLQITIEFCGRIFADVTVFVGTSVGTKVGSCVGTAVGSRVGNAEGTDVGSRVGSAVGSIVGSNVGSSVGSEVGSVLGSAVGSLVGWDVEG